MSARETAHTPGPWLREGRTVYALNPTGTNQFSANVQGGWTWQGHEPPASTDRTADAELEANTRLIAAAPDLLAALKAMDAALCAGFETQAGRMAGRKALIAARAAVAKAEEPRS